MSNGDEVFATVCQARYSGAYEGAPWLAFEGVPEQLPQDWNAGDEAAAEFFLLGSSRVGRGVTPCLAYDDLRRRAGLVGEPSAPGDSSLSEYYPITIVGSSLGLAPANRWTAIALHPQMLRVVITHGAWSLETMAVPPFPTGTASTADDAVSAMLRNRDAAL